VGESDATCGTISTIHSIYRTDEVAALYVLPQECP